MEIYAFKRGEYEKCLQLCEQNVNKLQFAYELSVVCQVSSSALLLLVDYDILSLVGLTVEFLERYKPVYSNFVTQTIVSLYLLVQCKLQLRHSVTSLAAVLHLVQRHYRRQPVRLIFDRSTLAFVYRKARRTLHNYEARRNETPSLLRILR